MVIEDGSASAGRSKPHQRPRSNDLRIKPRKRLIRQVPAPVAVAEGINQMWSMDFMHDPLADGRSIRLRMLPSPYESLG